MSIEGGREFGRFDLDGRTYIVRDGGPERLLVRKLIQQVLDLERTVARIFNRDDAPVISTRGYGTHWEPTHRAEVLTRSIAIYQTIRKPG